MRIAVIALLAAIIGGAATWLYGDNVSDREDRSERAALAQLVEEYITAINTDDRERLEELTVGQARFDLIYDMNQPVRNDVTPPFVGILIAAVNRRGPAEIEKFSIDALSDTVAVGHVRTSFANPRHPDRRSYLTNTSAQMLFEKENGIWRINGTVIG